MKRTADNPESMICVRGTGTNEDNCSIIGSINTSAWKHSHPEERQWALCCGPAQT